MFTTKHCNVCLKSKKALFNIIELDVNNEWNHNHLICFICVEQLNATYDFKALCLKSFDIEFKAVNPLSDNIEVPDGLLLLKNDSGQFSEEPGGSNISNLVENADVNISQLDVKAVEADEISDLAVIDDFFNTKQEDSSDVFPDISLCEFIPVENKKQKEYMCNICDKVYKNVQTLKAHRLSVHTDRSEWVNDCYVCDKIFASKGNLTQHILYKHLEKGTFVCFNCNRSFILKHLLVFHIKEQHSPPRGNKIKRSFDCTVCNQVFSTKCQLLDHAATEHGIDAKDIKPYKCDVCGKGFVKRTDLKIHETYHFNNFTHRCPDCGQTFKNNKLLYAHKVSKHVEPDKWKFCCNICGKRFPRVCGYKMHMRRHMGDKRFICHLCDKKFASKFQLIRHVESHSNVKRFRCQFCGKEYREKRIFNIHLLDVHGVGESPKERKVCHICPMTFSCNYKLRRHVLNHSKPYTCTLCDKKYSDNYHLKQHLQKKHKIIEMKVKADDSSLDASMVRLDTTVISLDATVKEEENIVSTL